MNSYESTLYSQLVLKIEEAREKNKNRALAQYADVNFYHAAVAREIALIDILSWMNELKEKVDKA